MKRLRWWMFVGIVMVLSIQACGSLSEPESCGEIGGTANEVLFDQNFVLMELVNATTGDPGEYNSEGEVQVGSSDSLSIPFEIKNDVSIRVCLQERKGGGKILFNETKSFTSGENSLTLGTYSKGGYVVRVIMDEALIKNLPFRIE